MTIIAAYGNVGTYRATAAICGTTPKTVRRVIERAEVGDGPPPRQEILAVGAAALRWTDKREPLGVRITSVPFGRQSSLPPCTLDNEPPRRGQCDDCH